MADYVHLVGAEQVRNAASSMGSSAETNMRAAGYMLEAATKLERSVQQLEYMLQALSEKVDQALERIEKLAAEGEG